MLLMSETPDRGSHPCLLDAQRSWLWEFNRLKKKQVTGGNNEAIKCIISTTSDAGNCDSSTVERERITPMSLFNDIDARNVHRRLFRAFHTQG